MVAFTMGNHPAVDIMVTSPSGVPFLVDVKGQYKGNWWIVSPKKDLGKLLFYVFAFVPDDGANRFFVLTQAQVNSEVEAEFERYRAPRVKDGRPVSESFLGVGQKFLSAFENKWREVLPS